MFAQKYDILVYGASGFTGKHVVDLLWKTKSKSKLSWAVGGRDLAKLQSVLQSCGAKNIPIVVADTRDKNSLIKEFSNAHVVINCVGPYRYYGQAVVEACLAAGASYVDITGEPEFIERSQALFHESAKSKNCTIVHACGFDSVPADIGTLYVKREMAKLNVVPLSVEMFHTITPGSAGVSVNYTTYECAVLGFGAVEELRTLRKTSKRPQLKRLGPKLRIHQLPHFNPIIGKYSVPFPGADAAVVKLSQQLLLANYPDKTEEGPISKVSPEHLPPVQFAAYFTLPTLFQTVLLCIYGIIFGFLAKFTWGRKLLLQNPELFTRNVVRKREGGGPTQKQIQESSFITHFLASGSRNVTVPLSKTHNADFQLHAAVRGPDAGYVAAPLCVVTCAYLLLEEREKIPHGVFTPAAAFAKTSIIEKLENNNIHFSVIAPTSTQGQSIEKVKSS